MRCPSGIAVVFHVLMNRICGPSVFSLGIGRGAGDLTHEAILCPPNVHRKHHEPFLDTVDGGTWSTAGTVEHKLEYTEVYNLFLEHFEAKISGTQ